MSWYRSDHLKLWQRNRIAAIESRNRKQEKIRQLEHNLELLKIENNKLGSENDILRE